MRTTAHAIGALNGNSAARSRSGTSTGSYALEADGVLVGLVAGLVGAGGGFLVVPALALLGGLSMPAAVGTSLLVIAMKSASGLAGHLSAVPIGWFLACAVAMAAVLGSLLGGSDRAPGWPGRPAGSGG